MKYSKFISAMLLFFSSIKNQTRGEQIIESLQNGNMKCYLEGPYSKNISHTHFSTKTSYFDVQNEDTEEIKIEGMYSVILIIGYPLQDLLYKMNPNINILCL